MHRKAAAINCFCIRIYLTYVCMHGCMHGCMYVCMHVCMHACMYSSILYTYIISYIYIYEYLRVCVMSYFILKKAMSISGHRSPRWASSAAARSRPGTTGCTSPWTFEQEKGGFNWG